MSDDLISRQAALYELHLLSIEALKKHRFDYDALITICSKKLKNLPSVQSEQKTGRWITKGKDLHYCSECGWVLLNSMNGERYGMGFDFHRQNPERWEAWIGWQEQLMNYCPNCGAKMESDNHDN